MSCWAAGLGVCHQRAVPVLSGQCRWGAMWPSDGSGVLVWRCKSQHYPGGFSLPQPVVSVPQHIHVTIRRAIKLKHNPTLLPHPYTTTLVRHSTAGVDLMIYNCSQCPKTDSITEASSARDNLIRSNLTLYHFNPPCLCWRPFLPSRGGMTSTDTDFLREELATRVGRTALISQIFHGGSGERFRVAELVKASLAEHRERHLRDEAMVIVCRRNNRLQMTGQTVGGGVYKSA
ncbi:hypothetical protein DPEC_G00347440 [Dallia pectoralis]|uniref:Uncharacterized protein n=1 Tax=Dallia pectoralis TaxID=75939 RepID=A0ACC2F437_DALPE|nr:hypothetical protein DPEC_G00347440 [Dallia pectoralis]